MSIEVLAGLALVAVPAFRVAAPVGLLFESR
jgi:hypothetical protein